MACLALLGKAGEARPSRPPNFKEIWQNERGGLS